MSKKMRKKSAALRSRVKPSGNTASKGKPLKKSPIPKAKTVNKPTLKMAQPASVATSLSKAKGKPRTAVSGKSTKIAAETPPTVAGLTEGETAPTFDLPRDGGGRLSLRDFQGRKLVLFFYPRAGTPGCTKEAMEFSRLAKQFASSGAEVVGISSDSLEAQDVFKRKYQLGTPLLSDERREIIEAYGAWGEKSMYGRTFLGILRTTVLVGSNGKIARIWRRVRVDGHAEEVLAAVRSL